MLLVQHNAMRGVDTTLDALCQVLSGVHFDLKTWKLPKQQGSGSGRIVGKVLRYIWPIFCLVHTPV